MKKWVEDPLRDSTIEWLLTSLKKEQTTTENALRVAFSIGVLSMGKKAA